MKKTLCLFLSFILAFNLSFISIFAEGGQEDLLEELQDEVPSELENEDNAVEQNQGSENTGESPSSTNNGNKEQDGAGSSGLEKEESTRESDFEDQGGTVNEESSSDEGEAEDSRESKESQKEDQQEPPVSKFTDEDLPDSYVVMDAQTGDVLFSKGEHNKTYMGSMTYIMTSILLLEKFSPSDKITSPEDFSSPGGSSIAVDSGETFTLEQLLHAMVLSFADDVAKTLAIAHSGSEEAFVKAMNDKALKLGMKDSTFLSPYHSKDEGQLSSIKDIAIMLKEAMKNESFREAMGAKNYEIPPTNKKSEARNYINQQSAFLLENGQVMDYMGTSVNIFDPEVSGANMDVFSDGTYLGYTVVTQDKLPLIFVSFGKGDANRGYAEQKALMEKTKTEYGTYTLVVKGEVVAKLDLKNKENTTINMLAKKNITVLLPKNINLEKDIVREVKRKNLSNVVIEKGVKIGTLTLKYQGKEIGKVDLVAESSLSESGFLGDLSDAKDNRTPFEKVMSVAGIIIKIIIIFIVWTFVVAKHRQRLRKKEKRENLRNSWDSPQSKNRKR